MANCTRCQFKNLTNNNICKHKSKNVYYIFDKKSCLFHYNYYGKLYATNIQRIYRGYKCRKCLNNVYNRLPDDLQNIVKFYINQDLHYKKYLKKIWDIVLLKILDFIYRMALYTNRYNTFLFQLRGDALIEFGNFIYEERDNILYNFNLYFKYEDVLNNKNIKATNTLPAGSILVKNYSSVISHNLKKYKDLLNTSLYYYEQIINNHNTNHIFEANSALNNKLNKLYNTSKRETSFS